MKTLAVAVCLVLLGAFTGCATTYTVLIDAISNPAKPPGTTYRLEVNDPAGGVDKELGVLAIAHGKDALAARGLSEAPAGTKPDMIIELECGRDPARHSGAARSRATGPGTDWSANSFAARAGAWSAFGSMS